MHGWMCGVGQHNNWHSIPLAPLRSAKGGLHNYVIPAHAGIQSGLGNALVMPPLSFGHFPHMNGGNPPLAP